MNFEVQDRAMASRALAMLGHRKSSRQIRLERHHRGRSGRDLDFDVVAVQVQRDRLVARPSQLELITLDDADGITSAGDATVPQRKLEDLAWGSIRGLGRAIAGNGRLRQCRGDAGNKSQRHDDKLRARRGLRRSTAARLVRRVTYRCSIRMLPPPKSPPAE
jgi:hypothetical protein